MPSIKPFRGIIYNKSKIKDIAASVKGAMANLLDELRLSFSYYENQCGKSVDEIYVSGGSAGMPGLGEAFRGAFGAEPHSWDPLQFLDKGPGGADKAVAEGMKGSFAVAAGLALRQV